MKTFKTKSLIIILLSVLALNFSAAKIPVYKLTLQNLKSTAPNALEFDIYLQHSNPDETKFEYILGQYFIEFNPEIANGGTLTYSIVSSDLPSSLQPRNPSVKDNKLRLAVNPIPSKENLPIIAHKDPGTLIVRMKLETSAKEFSDQSLNLKFRTGPQNPFTKIFIYEDNKIVDVTIPEEAEVDNNSIVNKSNIEIPNSYALFQNFPNPFNPATTIKFDIPKSSNVNISIYDLTGRELTVLVNEKLEPGSYEYKWNASQFASGLYFYRIKSESFIETKKMLLIK